MRRTLAIGMLAAVSLAPMGISPAQAQDREHHRVRLPLTALALSDLSFGTVLPGIPTSVSVLDVHQAGLFEIQGPSDASVRVDFLLPTALTSEEGATLPIAFGHSDGYADFSHGHPRRSRTFDPHRPVIGTLGPNGHLFVWLGGTVQPDRAQARGRYRATIALTVYNLGS
ncbi:MAG TPA: hypothetical protein VEH62_12600 [Gemmatimonadales bacterium]|nr:hypothetical protein [Gemmatimonadales bacterium]